MVNISFYAKNWHIVKTSARSVSISIYFIHLIFVNVQVVITTSTGTCTMGNASLFYFTTGNAQV